MTTPISSSAPADAATTEAMVRDLPLRIQNLTLDDVESMKTQVSERPFDSLSTAVLRAKELKNMPDEQLKEVVYLSFKQCLKSVEHLLTPAQLLFGSWFFFSLAKDGHERLFECIFLHACRVLEDDFSSETFVPEPPSTEWIDVLREKLKGSTHFSESVDAFIEAIQVLKDDKFPVSCCRLQFWHIFCCLLKKAFPDIVTQKAKAFALFLTIKSPIVIAASSRGLKYLFQPPTIFPISYEGWAKEPEPHSFALEGIVEYMQANHKICSFETLNDALFVIEALLGDKAYSETFPDKIQGKYLPLFVRLAEGTSMPMALAAPLIARLCKENTLQFSGRIAAINEVMSHASVNACEFDDGIKIYRLIFAFLRQLQDLRLYACYEHNMKSVLEKMARMVWSFHGAFYSERTRIKEYSVSSSLFEQVRAVRASFAAAKNKFPENSWPLDGERLVTILYMKLLVETLKMIKQQKKPGIGVDRWHAMIFRKNELVVELVKSLYSVQQPFTEKFICRTMTPLLNTNVSRFGHELIIYKKDDLFFIGKRENIEVLNPPTEQNRAEKPKPQPPYYIAPHGSIVRRNLAKKLPPSPLAKEIRDEDAPEK